MQKLSKSVKICRNY